MIKTATNLIKLRKVISPSCLKGVEFSDGGEMMRSRILFSSVISPIILFGTIIILCAFILSCVGAATNPVTSLARTRDLLNIHEAIAPTFYIEYDSAKLVFFSDLHRGMGERDFFKDNRKLFLEILKYYFEEGFSLVLIGDIEEGWGFQADNIPIILQWHKDAYDLEKKFADSQRYYRIYGNHDDYYRSNPVGYGKDILTPVFPAVIFKDENKKKRIFVTHGCQGHGLHDAGDQVAAWGVFARYNWLLEILPNKEQAGAFTGKAEKIKADFDKHEQYLYDWADEKNYDVLIAGHTHRPIYNLDGVSYSFKVLKEDIRNRNFPSYFYYSDEKEPEIAGTPRTAPARKIEISDKLRNKMLGELDKEELMSESQPLIQKRYDKRGNVHAEYYNPGCGYLSEIPCMELKDGQISHKYFSLSPDGKLGWKILDQKTKTMMRETPKIKGEK